MTSLKGVIRSVICMLLFVPSLYAQYNYQYQGVRWNGNSVTYHIYNDMSTIYATQQDFENGIDSAAAQWNNAGAYFQFEKGTDVTTYEPGQEPAGTFEVSYITLINSDTTATTAVTTVNGELTKVETYFNYQYEFAANPNSSQLDIWTTAAHEFGHWLDLLDEVTTPQDVMYQDLSYGDTSRRHLASDDQNGIIYIYGRINSTVTDDIGQSESWYGNITVAQKK
ncbi:MAG: matrixin family metalloprotease [Bacteroidetes bacterium]|nr:matrixin family metalloprotease [Bacteroidota bacterium]